MSNTIQIVENEYEAREMARQKRIGLYDEEKQGIFTDISTVISPLNQELVTINKRMERVHSSNERFDQLIFKGVSVDDAQTIFDMGVRSKVEDVVLPYKKSIQYYGPLTDVESEDMSFFVTKDALGRMEDTGVDFNIFDEELDEIRSVEASTDQEDLAIATYNHRETLSSIKRQMAMCSAQIISRHPEWKGLLHDEFIQKLLRDGDGQDCKRYIELDAQLRKNKAFIDKYSAEIMADSIPIVFVPDHIDRSDIMLPAFDISTERFMAERLPIDNILEIVNQDPDRVPEIELANLEIEL